MITDAIDPTNPVVALCVEGMAREGTPAEARRLFERAWEARRDDFDAAVASARLAAGHLTALSAGGYREFVALGVRRLAARAQEAAGAELTD